MPSSFKLSSLSCGRLIWTLLLGVAMLWAQQLGLQHQLRHLSHHPLVAEHTQPSLQAETHVGVLGHLFTDAADNNDCRLYDQLGQFAGLSGSALLLGPISWPSLALVALQAIHLPAWWSPLCARAPPTPLR